MNFGRKRIDDQTDSIEVIELASVLTGEHCRSEGEPYE